MSEREQALEKIIRDTLWMARRYADGRMTDAVSVVNFAVRQAEDLGIEILPDNTLRDRNGRLALDGATYIPESPQTHASTPEPQEDT